MYSKDKLLFLLILLLGDPLSKLAAQHPATVWEVAVSDGKDAAAKAIIQNWEGNFVFAGTTRAKSGRGKDIYLGSIGATTGAVLFTETIVGGNADEEANAVVQTADGGYILAGYTASTRMGSAGKQDAWWIRTDEKGQVLKDALIGTGGDDAFLAMIQNDLGQTFLTGYSNGRAFLVKMDSDGKVIWQKTLNQNVSRGTALSFAKNGDLIIVGYEGDEKEMKKKGFVWHYTAETGALNWQHPFDNATFNAVQVDILGNIHLAGATYLNAQYKNNFFYLKTDADGKELKRKDFGNIGEDRAFSLALDGGENVFLAGQTFSQSGRSYTSDMFLYKVKTATGESAWSEKKPLFKGGQFDDFAAASQLSYDGKLVTAGETNGRAWILCFNTEGVKMGQKTTLKINSSRLVEPSGDGILSEGERGFYEIWVENIGMSLAQNVRLVINPNENNKAVNFSPKNYYGDIAAGEKKRLTIPLSTNGTANRWVDFSATLLADNVVSSQQKDFSVQIEKALRSQLVLENFVFSVDNQQVMSRRTVQTLTFEVINKGDKAAEGVRVATQFPNRVEVKNTPSVKDKIGVGEKQKVSVNFVITNSYAPNVLPIQVIVFEEKQGLQTEQSVSVKVKDFENDNQKVEPIAVARNETILTWLAPDPIEQNDLFVDGETFKLKIRAISTQPLTVDNFDVFVNGQKLPKGEKADKIKLKGAQNQNHEYTFVQEVDLTEGVNKLEVEVKNVVGTKRSSTARVTRQTVKPNLHLLTIGVVHDDLKFPPQDATDLAAVFEKQRGQLFGEIYTTVLNQKINTKAADMRRAFIDIQRQFLTEKKIRLQDVVVVFISSHGKVMGASKQFRIAASDFDDLYPTETTLDFQQNIMTILAEVDCKKLLLMDACESGGVQLNWTEGAKSLTATPSVDEALTQLAAAKAGTRCITSSKMGELSYEDEKWRNGAFTEALTEAFKNTEVVIEGQKLTADADKNGFLTITELYDFVNKRVPQLVKTVKNKVQTPQLINCKPEDSFPIFKF